MRVSLSPFSSRVQTPLQRYVSSKHGQTKNVKSFSIFHAVEWCNWNSNPRFFIKCHTSKSKHWGDV